MRKKCNDCDLCCYLTGVPELGKPVNTACKFGQGKGCSIYENRPPSCRKFRCSWLDIKKMPEILRPDLCNIMFERLPNCTTYIALTKPGHYEAWLEPEVQKILKHLVLSGSAVVVNTGLERHMLLPPNVTVDEVWKDVQQAYLIYQQGVEAWQSRPTQQI